MFTQQGSFEEHISKQDLKHQAAIKCLHCLLEQYSENEKECKSGNILVAIVSLFGAISSVGHMSVYFLGVHPDF